MVLLGSRPVSRPLKIIQLGLNSMSSCQTALSVLGVQGQPGEEQSSSWERWAQSQVAKARMEGKQDGQIALDWLRGLQATSGQLRSRVAELEADVQTEHAVVQVQPLLHLHCMILIGGHLRAAAWRRLGERLRE